MMNYQYPQTYFLDNPEQLIKMDDPPILPSLDPTEVEQTLYQRRDAPESLQPLQINNYTNARYYAENNSNQSAPVTNKNALANNTVLFSKTPQTCTDVTKPLATPSTPPPPINNNTCASIQSSSSKTGKINAADIVAITPQSHANIHSNSASNHSLASNNTTATTHIESASNHSHHSSHHSNSIHSPVQPVPGAHAHAHTHTHANVMLNTVTVQNNNNNGMAMMNTMVSNNKLQASTVPVPQLANPLPPVSNSNMAMNQMNMNHMNHMNTMHNKVEGIVIPMDQQNYNVLLQQMYPSTQFFNSNMQQTDRYNPAPSNNPYSRHNYTASVPAMQDDLGDIYGNTMAAPLNIYSTYDTNPYLYNTPPLPSNNGYYAHNTSSNKPPTYYPQQPVPPTHPYNNTFAPQQPQQLHHTQPIAPAHAQYQPYATQPIAPAQTHPHAQYNNQNQNNYYNAHTCVIPVQPSPHAHTHNTHPSISPKTVINPPNNVTVINNSSSQNNNNVQYLQRCDGTIISPNADPLSTNCMLNNRNKDDEADAFTAGDDALFGNNMITIINVSWTTNIPFATIRMHVSNRIHHVPLMDLNHIPNDHKMVQLNKNKNMNAATMANNNNRYRMGTNNMNTLNNNNHSTNSTNNIGTKVIRRNPKLSDETLMKLPHLRKHREYIRTIDVSMGPKDYNSYRVSVNSKNNNSNNNSNHTDDNTDINNGNNGRTANIQNLNAKGHSTNLNANLNLNANNKRKNKRMSACEKGDLFKTELCENWVKKGHCTYGKKCHFAHGRDDIRTRWRIENYKTQPCCDPARADSRLCLFGKRCNYAHPGEPLRRSHHCLYLDEEYQMEILKDYGTKTPYPFGIYI